MIFQPPFPEITEGEAILQMGFLYFIVVLLCLALLLMHYAYKVVKDFSLVVINWLFSIIFGFGMLENLGVLVDIGITFVLFLPIMFILWQTTLLILASIDFYNKKNRERKND